MAQKRQVTMLNTYHTKMIIYFICYLQTIFCMMTSTHSLYWSRNQGQREEWLACYILCLDPNLVDHDAVYYTGHWTLSSHSPQNHDTCISSHEFCDIHFLVAQTSQCQSACLNVPKTEPKSCSGGGRIGPHGPGESEPAPGQRTGLRNADLGDNLLGDNDLQCR